MIEWIKRLFKRKPTLRERCVEAYGEDFGKMYDMLGAGQPIGSFQETCVFLSMVESVRLGQPYKTKIERE